MKPLIRPIFCLALAAVFTLGAGLVLAPEAKASGFCPPCTVPTGAGGWDRYGSCDDYSIPHCPVVYRTYMNQYTGQICREQGIFLNI